MFKSFLFLSLLTVSGSSFACQCISGGFGEYNIKEYLKEKSSVVGRVDFSTLKIISDVEKTNVPLMVYYLAKMPFLTQAQQCDYDCSFGRRMVAKVEFANEYSKECRATLVKPAHKLYKVVIKNFECK